MLLLLLLLPALTFAILCPLQQQHAQTDALPPSLSVAAHSTHAFSRKRKACIVESQADVQPAVLTIIIIITITITIVIIPACPPLRTSSAPPFTLSSSSTSMRESLYVSARAQSTRARLRSRCILGCKQKFEHDQLLCVLVLFAHSTNCTRASQAVTESE